MGSSLVGAMGQDREGSKAIWAAMRERGAHLSVERESVAVYITCTLIKLTQSHSVFIVAD